MSNLTSTLTLALVDDGLAKKAAADAEALKRLGASSADLKKLAAANPQVAKTVAHLDQLAARGAKLDAFRAGARNLKEVGQQMRAARAEVGVTAAALAKADGKGTRAAEKNHKAALRRAEAITDAWRDQARAHRDLRKTLVNEGVAFGARAENGGRGLALGAAMRAVATDTEHANNALREQVRLAARSAEQARAVAAAAPQRAQNARDALRSTVQAGKAMRAERLEAQAAAKAAGDRSRADNERRRASAGRDMLSGMGGAGRAQLSEVEARRRVAAGMGAPARARAEAAEAAAAERTAASQDARERGKQVVGAGLLVAGHKAAEKKAEVLHTYREFDDLIRYQGAVADLTPGERDSRVNQSIHLGATTRFNDIQVLHAQLDLAQRGVKKEFIEPFIGEVVNYAQAMNTDLGSAAKTLEGIVFGTNQNVEDPASALSVMRRNVDMAVKMAKIGGLDNEDVAQAFKFGGPSGSGAGLSNETMGAMFALLRRTGFDGSEAGVATRAVASKLVSPTSKGLDALTAMGLNYRDYTTMPPDARPDVATSAFKRGFGKEMSKNQKARIAALIDDPDRFGDMDTFVADATEIASGSFDKGKNGKMKANDRKQVSKLFQTLWKNMVASVDSERLFSDILGADPTLAQANAFFTDKHGGKIQAIARKKELFAEYQHKLKDTPEGFAKGVGDQRNAGYAGASARLAGAGLNLDTSVARSLDNGGKGDGFLTNVTSASANAVQALAELPSPLLAVGASAGYLGGKLATLVGGAILSGATEGILRAAAAGHGAAVLTGASAAAAAAAPVVATLAVGAALASVDKSKAIVHGGKNVDTRLDPGDELPGLGGESQRRARRVASLPPGWGDSEAPRSGAGFTGPNTGAARAAEGVRSLIEKPPAMDPAAIQAAQAALAGYRTELAGIKADMAATFAIDPAGIGTALEGRKAELEHAIEGVEAKLKAIGDANVAPKVDASALDSVKPKADEAKGAVEAVGAVTARPTIDTSSIAAAKAEAEGLLSVLQQIPGASASATRAAQGAGAAVGALRGRSGNNRSFSDGVTPGRGAE